MQVYPILVGALTPHQAHEWINVLVGLPRKEGSGNTANVDNLQSYPFVLYFISSTHLSQHVIDLSSSTHPS